LFPETDHSLCSHIKMAFRGLTADRTPLEEFRSRAPRIDRRHEPTSDNYLPLHAFRWIEGEPSGAEICDLKSVGELVSHSEGALCSKRLSYSEYRRWIR